MESDIALIPIYDKFGNVKATVKVDPVDAKFLNQWRWSLDGRGYAKRTVVIGGRKGRHKTLLMHRLIMGLKHGDKRQVDHINGDQLDNRRSNLRIVTPAQQQQNRRASSNSTSRYRGVSLRKKDGKWIAHVVINGTQRYLGSFNSEKEAAQIVAEYRRKHMPFSREAL